LLTRKVNAYIILALEKSKQEKMTDNQWELLVMHGGMIMDGLSSTEAIALIILMGEPSEDIRWLVQKLKGGKNVSSRDGFTSR